MASGLFFLGYFSDSKLVLLEYAETVSNSIRIIVQDVFYNLQLLGASGIFKPQQQNAAMFY